MDPVTLALIGAAILAGVGIKRSAAPPPRPRSEGAPEAPSFPGGFPPHAFGGGLRPPVTHRAVSKERNIEGEAAGEKLPEEIKPVGIIAGSARAQQVIASSQAADVAGGGVTRTFDTTYTRPTYSTPQLGGQRGFLGQIGKR